MKPRGRMVQVLMVIVVVAIFISADSFLHHMVRNVVGSLVEIGRGKRPPEWMAALLLRRDRTRAGPTAPAGGLTLLRVSYPFDRALIRSWANKTALPENRRAVGVGLWRN